MQFPGLVPFDGVHILDCAGADDMRTAQYLRDDLLHVCACDFEQCGNRRQFFSSLRRLADHCADGYRPVLHVDAHGSQAQGLRVGSDLVSWAELGERLARINAKTRNGLGVVLAACHGIYGIDALDIERPSPFAYLVGPPDVISQGALRDAMSRFYKTLVSTGNLAQAGDALGKGFVVFRSAQFFYMVFRGAFRMQSIGAGARQHVEELVTRAVNEGIVRDAAHLAEVRRMMRFNNRYPEQTYLRVGQQFLHGQELAPFAEFLQFVRDEP